MKTIGDWISFIAVIAMSIYLFDWALTILAY
jgi:hypothetical protein